LDEDEKDDKMLVDIISNAIDVMLYTNFIIIRNSFDGISPPHFYGELAKTDEGCQLLKEKGHFRDFAKFIREHGLESRDTSVIAKLKSVLWAVVSTKSYLL
jgi:hypothetical protein